MVALAFALTACGGTDGVDDADDDLADFIAVAENHDCAEDVNRLYSIDGERVLWHYEEMGCADASYGVVLFGATPDDELCTSYDTIAGPLTECRDQAAMAEFEMIVSNLDDPDRGLGGDHDVELVWDEAEAG